MYVVQNNVQVCAFVSWHFGFPSLFDTGTAMFLNLTHTVFPMVLITLFAAEWSGSDSEPEPSNLNFTHFKELALSAIYLNKSSAEAGFQASILKVSRSHY
jgi:magnesium-transporting ATPase (P-type)